RRCCVIASLAHRWPPDCLSGLAGAGALLPIRGLPAGDRALPDRFPSCAARVRRFPRSLRRFPGRGPCPVLVSGLPAAVMFAAQPGYLFLEVGQRLESPVHRGEAQVGNLVQVTERPQDREADLIGGNLPAAAAPDRVFYPLGQDGQLVFGDPPSLAGALYPSDGLVPGERIGDASAR